MAELEDVLGESQKGHGDHVGYVVAGAEVGVDYEGPTASVYVLTSLTYLNEGANFDENLIVGVFVSHEAALDYKENAVPPVTDGKIVKWGVQGSNVVPVGRIAPFHGVSE